MTQLQHTLTHQPVDAAFTVQMVGDPHSRYSDQLIAALTRQLTRQSKHPLTFISHAGKCDLTIRIAHYNPGSRLMALLLGWLFCKADLILMCEFSASPTFSRSFEVSASAPLVLWSRSLALHGVTAKAARLLVKEVPPLARRPM